MNGSTARLMGNQPPLNVLPDMLAMRIKLLTVELFTLRKAAEAMAEHILAQPAVGIEQVSEVRMTASQILAARGTGSQG